MTIDEMRAMVDKMSIIELACIERMAGEEVIRRGKAIRHLRRENEKSQIIEDWKSGMYLDVPVTDEAFAELSFVDKVAVYKRMSGLDLVKAKTIVEFVYDRIAIV